MMAFASLGEIEIVGITTSSGNAAAWRTQKNALMLCEFAGRRDHPVFAGCDRPLVKEAHYATVHGQTGIDGFASFEPTVKGQTKHAVDFIIDTLLAHEDGEVTLACLAPLTNLAVALVKEPRITPKIKEIVLMGGARRSGGNITPAATFNIFFDPHAAHVIFNCGRPVIAVSLDACSDVLFSKKWLQRLRSSRGRVSTAMADLVAHFDAVRIKRFGLTTDGASVNDPCVIAYLINPELFGRRTVNVEIETSSSLTMGMTVVDFWGISGRTPNAVWVHEADGERVMSLLTDRISQL